MSIEKISSSGNVDTYKITYTSGEPTTFTITNGSNGQAGETGNGIVSIEKVSTVGNIDTYKIIYTNGTNTTFAVTNGVNGTNGKSAYELAVEKGYEGDLESWLLTLVGAKGEDGLSAYEIAVRAGFEGTEQDWLDSLKGKAGVGVADIKCEYGYDQNGVYCMIFTFTMTDGSIQIVYAAIPKQINYIYLSNGYSFSAVDEKTEISGLMLTIYYEDNTSEEIPVTKSMISGIEDFSVVGTYENVKISYQGKTITETIRITPNLNNLTKMGNLQVIGSLQNIMQGATLTVYEENYCKITIQDYETIMQWQYVSQPLSDENKIAQARVYDDEGNSMILTIDTTNPTEEYFGTCDNYKPSAQNAIKVYNGYVMLDNETPATITIYNEENIGMLAELSVIVSENQIMQMNVTEYSGADTVVMLGERYKLIADGTFKDMTNEALEEKFAVSDLSQIKENTDNAVKEIYTNVYNQITGETNSYYTVEGLNERLSLSINPYVEIGDFENIFNVNIRLGDTYINQDQMFTLSIGNSVYIKDKAIKVENGKIYLFASILATEATNVSQIEVNGFVENFDIFNENNTIKINNIAFADDKLSVINKINDNEYQLNIKAINKMLAFYYNGAEVNDVILTKKEYSYNNNGELYYGFTGVDEINSQSAYAIYPFGWVTDASSINSEVNGSTLIIKAYVLNKGMFNVMLYINLDLQ